MTVETRRGGADIARSDLISWSSIVAGVLADRAGMPFAINVIAVLTAASGIVVLVRMRETRPVP